MEKISILLADDHRIFREGIKALLEKEKDILVVGEASSADEIFAIISQKKVNVILMDIDMGESSGIAATEKIISQFHEIKILALSMHSEHNYIIKMLEAGAKGYILKNTGKEELVTAIKSVYRGDSYFSSEVSGKLIDHLRSANSIKNQNKRSDIPLTPREIEVLKLIAMEYSNAQIAEKLFISQRTVDTHKRNLLEKLGLKNTAGLVKYAISKNLTD